MPYPSASLSFTREAAIQSQQAVGALTFGRTPTIPSTRRTCSNIHIDGPLKITPAGSQRLVSPQSFDPLASCPPTNSRSLRITRPARPKATPVPTLALEVPLVIPRNVSGTVDPAATRPAQPTESEAPTLDNPVVSSPVLSSPLSATAVVAPLASPAPGLDTRTQTQLLTAVGEAIESYHGRHGRDLLHMVLTAQEEQHASLVQVLADQRREYGDQLERAVIQMSERMPDSLIEAGEAFHESAGKLTGALSRIERLFGHPIEKHNLSLQLLGDIRAHLSQILAIAAEVRDLLEHNLAGRPQPRHERRLAVVPASSNEPDDGTDILAEVRDDLAEPEDIQGPR